MVAVHEECVVRKRIILAVPVENPILIPAYCITARIRMIASVEMQPYVRGIIDRVVE